MTDTMPARMAMALATSEADWQGYVVARAHARGWWCWHDRDSRGNEAGLPDLIMIKPPRVIFAELKSERGRLADAQRYVLELLERCAGIERYLWRPSDVDAVDRILDGWTPPDLQPLPERTAPRTRRST